MAHGRPVPGLLLVASLSAAGTLGAQGPGVGDAAPVVAVHDLDGRPVDLGQWIGKTPVFLEFWATWCTSCQALEPAVRAAREAYGAGVEFIGINITVGDPRDSVRAWGLRGCVLAQRQSAGCGWTAGGAGGPRPHRLRGRRAIVRGQD